MEPSCGAEDKELELLISGLPDIDIEAGAHHTTAAERSLALEDLKANTEYYNYTAQPWS